ncbi:UNVERIFIED_CONTAM: hypothetical protein Slati_1129500 [Sesamum latifolium]|uniref:Uncharacterized protein n=1 Tax=Sesamum latifolium TaxID=2727402 RepID=A0AAW2XE78_9LAMI
MGARTEEQADISFTEGVMADELPVNCRTPAIAEYDGTTDPHEHLSRFENAVLLHRYTDDIKWSSLRHYFFPGRAKMVQPIVPGHHRKLSGVPFPFPAPKD